MTQLLNLTKLLNIPKIQQFQYSIMNSQDFDQVVDITAKAFATNDPYTLNSNISEQEFKDFIYLFKEHFLAQQLSLIVKDTSTEKIVACLLSDDYNEHLGKKIQDQFKQKLRHYQSVFDSARQELLKQKLIPSSIGKVYHMNFGATHYDYMGLGLTQQLSILTQHLAWSLGYSHMISESTSPITQHICQKLGFVTIFESSFMNLKAIHHHKTMKIQVKELSLTNLTPTANFLQNKHFSS